MTIRLKRMDKESQSVPCDIGFYGYGLNFYLRLQTPHADLQLGATAQEFIDLLTPMLAEMRARLGQEPGPVALEMQARQDTFYHKFNLITIDDLTADLTTAEKWALFIQRFEGSDQMDDEVQIFKEMYKQAAGHDWADRELYRSKHGPSRPAQPQSVDPLDALRPHAADLLDEAGAPKWGAQVKAAALLGFPGTGGAFHKKILQYLHRLGAEPAKAA
jgi:hypothetical protein